MLTDETALSNAIIFNHAFDILYSRLEKSVIALKQNYNNKEAQLDAALVVPVLTIGSFACELYMKSLLPPNKKGHELHHLYNQLDEEAKRNILNIHLEFMRNSKPDYSLKEFNSDLRKHRNIFRKWRYFPEHETGTADISFIYILLKALNTVCRIEKEKKQYVSNML